MISLDEAFDHIQQIVRPILDHEICSLNDALGRITAADIKAPYGLPRFTNTGVDGYAIKHEAGRASYTLVGSSYAGEPYQGQIDTGQAARIATGAVLPEGADTVVMQEICTVQDKVLHISAPPEKGDNLRLAGDDIAQGQISVKAGAQLRAQDIALLGALGFKELAVKRRLRVAIASTGLELRAQGEDTTEPGTIIDTNTLMLNQLLTSPAIEVFQSPAIADDYKQTSAALKKLSQKHDIIITTGGVSVGDRDYVRDVLHKEGEVHFWKIAIRPGKPVVFASMGSSLIIGLPGNPVSAFVTSHLIVRAVLQTLWGKPTNMPEGFPIPLASEITKPAHLRCFFRGHFSGGLAIPYANQGSNLYSSITQAHGLIDLPAGKTSFAKGDIVIYRPFDIFF